MHNITFNPNYNVVLVPRPNQTVTLQQMSGPPVAGTMGVTASRPIPSLML